MHEADLLNERAAAGDVHSVRSLLARGVGVNTMSSDGRTALIAAVQNRQVQVAQILIAAGAQLEFETKVEGTALNLAENLGDANMVALLRAAGARSTGKSVGDTVCVRGWAGDGFCGRVSSFQVRSVGIHVTSLVGCAGGCKASEECSAGKPVGGTNGLQPGEEIAVPSWCLTHTGVKQ